MRILAIETATEACSVALFDGGKCLAHDHQIMGRGHAEQLVPMISTLPGKGQAERIIVSLGPGSFTGVRIGIATARALGVAWNVQVLGYPTLALIAAMAQEITNLPVTVCMNGGHGEWFVQNYDTGLIAQDDVQSLTPERAQLACKHNYIAGNRAQELAQFFHDGSKKVVDLLPDSRSSNLLPKSCLSHDLAPIYGRGPDAKASA